MLEILGLFVAANDTLSSEETSPVVVIPTESFSVEAIDDDVVIMSTFILGSIVLFLVGRFLRRQGEERVHPDERERVEAYRETHVVATAERMERVREERDHTCPICLDVAAFPILTDCGHVFCCSCLYNYWTYSSSILNPVLCAHCRSTVTMWLPLNWPTSEQAEQADEQDSLHTATMQLNEYNRRFSQTRGWLDVVRDIPVVIPFLVRSIFRMDALEIFLRLRVGFVVVALFSYLLIPLDIIPDSFHWFIGFIDDGLLFVMAFVYLQQVLRVHMAHRAN